MLLEDGSGSDGAEIDRRALAGEKIAQVADVSAQAARW